MGSSQSARKLTIPNENEEDRIIKVSNSVVERLAQKAESIASKAQDVRPMTPTSPASPAVTSVPVTSMPVLPPQSGDASGYPIVYCPELTISALELHQQKEQQLREQDQYWQKRVEELKKSHQRIEWLIKKEYEKAYEELSLKGSTNVNIKGAVQPCLETKEKVLKCYQDYSKETLKCSNLVEEYSNCVNQHRARVIAARC